jgi:hypothetical protein
VDFIAPALSATCGQMHTCTGVGILWVGGIYNSIALSGRVQTLRHLARLIPSSTLCAAQVSE